MPGEMFKYQLCIQLHNVNCMFMPLRDYFDRIKFGHESIDALQDLGILMLEDMTRFTDEGLANSGIPEAVIRALRIRPCRLANIQGVAGSKMHVIFHNGEVGILDTTKDGVTNMVFADGSREIPTLGREGVLRGEIHLLKQANVKSNVKSKLVVDLGAPDDGADLQDAVLDQVNSDGTLDVTVSRTGMKVRGVSEGELKGIRYASDQETIAHLSYKHIANYIRYSLKAPLVAEKFELHRMDVKTCNALRKEDWRDTWTAPHPQGFGLDVDDPDLTRIWQFVRQLNHTTPEEPKPATSHAT